MPLGGVNADAEDRNSANLVAQGGERHSAFWMQVFVSRSHLRRLLSVRMLHFRFETAIPIPCLPRLLAWQSPLPIWQHMLASPGVEQRELQR